MKKVLAAVLSATMLVGMLAFAGCGKQETLKFGLGVVASYSKATDATAEKNGAGESNATVATVLVDSQGKVVQMKLDVAQSKPAWTTEGKYVAADFLSKAQLKEDYGMSKIGKAEWYVQAEAFCNVCVGKTVDEIKALALDTAYGSDEVIKAGCTIHVSDFVAAAVLAMNNATESKATKDAKLGLGVSSVQHSCKDATAEANGLNEVDSTFAAVVYGADGKVIDSKIDVVQAKFSFDVNGAAKTDVTAALQSKEQLKEGYGMSKTGKVEWYIQAQNFSNFIVGKTAAEVAGVADSTGKGIEALQTAGCTITVSDFTKAVADAMK